MGNGKWEMPGNGNGIEIIAQYYHWTLGTDDRERYVSPLTAYLTPIISRLLCLASRLRMHSVK